MEKVKELGKQTQTNRGFNLLNFNDRFGQKCSMQQSSLATEDCIWLGVDDVDPVIMASDAKRLGIRTTENNGWCPYPIPKEVLLHTRMELTEDQVRSLIQHLQNWLKTGNF